MVKIARQLGINRCGPMQWKEIPLKHVFEVARLTGIKPELLRPDFFQGVTVTLAP